MSRPGKIIALSGSSGLVGTTLRKACERKGWQVRPLVRRAPRSFDEIEWYPESGLHKPESMSGVDALVHLAGENIASGRWTKQRKERIRTSRIEGTRKLSESLADLETGPGIFISASAVGYYGNRGEVPLTEADPPGEGFLARVCREWEEATQPALAAGIRVVSLRIGVVLSHQGGMLERLRPLFTMGSGGKLGSGKQYMSWISLADLVRIILYAIEKESLSGPVNATAPEPVTNAGFTQAFANSLGRSAPFAVPAPVLKLTMGEMAEEMLLGGARAIPAKLLESGFRFTHQTITDSLKPRRK